MNWVSQGVKIAGNKGFDGVLEHVAKLGIVAGMSDDDTADLTNQYLEIMKQVSEAKEEEEKQKQIEQSEQEASQQLQASVAPVPPAPPQQANITPVNTNITNPQQYSQLFPQDSIGGAIAEKKVI